MPSDTVAVVAGVSLAALRPVEIWHRLLSGSFGSDARLAYGYFRPALEIREAVPPSRRAATYALSDLVGWETLLGPLSPELSVAVNLRTGDVVLGPPTEEVWEGFEETVRAALSGAQ